METKFVNWSMTYQPVINADNSLSFSKQPVSWTLSWTREIQYVISMFASCINDN